MYDFSSTLEYDGTVIRGLILDDLRCQHTSRLHLTSSLILYNTPLPATPLLM